MIDLLIKRHVNLLRVILCVEVKESRPLYVFVHIFCGVFLKSDFCIRSYSKTNNLLKRHFTQTMNPITYNQFGQNGSRGNSNEEFHHTSLKNAASNIEQVLTATPHKTPTIRPPASQKLSKLDEADMQDTAGEAGTSS